jgi:hypothetical protein
LDCCETCQPEQSIMGAVCFGGQGITMTHRQDKSLLPKDCAKYCEDDEG